MTFAQAFQWVKLVSTTVIVIAVVFAIVWLALHPYPTTVTP